MSITFRDMGTRHYSSRLGSRSRATSFAAAVPLKAFFAKFSFILMVMLSVSLIAANRSHYQGIEIARERLLDLTAPVLNVLARPAEGIAHLSAKIAEMVNLYQANQQLRIENERLRQWHHVAQSLEAENHSLKGLLQFMHGPDARYVSARVVGTTSGPYLRSAIITVGENDGIRKGQAVTNSDGLVGRIIESGHHSARILLVTDLNSRIPVLSEQSRYRAVLAGTNSEWPELRYLPEQHAVQPGERLITSGDGGVFPAGIPVGTVVSTDNGQIIVKPLVSGNRLEFVNVMDYQIPE